MNPFTQGEGSSGPSVRPEKRRRGRPRRDPSLKDKDVAHVAAPFFEGMTKTLPREADSPNGAESVVGQSVSGSVEASFDAGYLLTVRIGDSSTNMRGVVFKPGHFVPVTTENDVAPHLQMIRRNDIHSPSENCSWSRRPKLAIKTAGQKSKHSSPKPANSVPPAGIGGDLMPVVLQPVGGLPSGLPSSRQMPSDASQNSNLLTFGDKDVHMAEPLSIVPPAHAIPPVGQAFIDSQLRSNHHVPQDNVENSHKPFNEGISGFGQGEKVEPMESTDADNLASSESSDTETEDGNEDTKSSAEEDSGLTPKQETGNMKEPVSTEPLQTASVANFSTASLQPSPVGIPLFCYGTGRMSELLQAVQENRTEKPPQMPKQQLPSTSNVDFGTMGAPATDKNN